MGDAINSVLAGLAFIPPNTTYSENNGVLSLTKVASRYAGMAAAGWLVFFGKCSTHSILASLRVPGVGC